MKNIIVFVTGIVFGLIAWTLSSIPLAYAVRTRPDGTLIYETGDGIGFALLFLFTVIVWTVASERIEEWLKF